MITNHFDGFKNQNIAIYKDKNKLMYSSINKDIENLSNSLEQSKNDTLLAIENDGNNENNTNN